MPRVAILMVNGFDRTGRYAAPLGEDQARAVDWLSLSLSQILRHTPIIDFEVLVYDNANWPEQRARIRTMPRVRVVTGDREVSHAEGLDLLVATTSSDVEFLVTMDTDAFPINDDWLSTLLEKLDSGYAMIGVWRDEMLPVLQPFIHPSCLAMRRDELLALDDLSFARNDDVDVGYNIYRYVSSLGRQVFPLRRTNERNVHFLLGGIYSDIVYHQGAGSRFPRFWLPSDPIADERARVLLQELAFDDLDRLIAYLRGTEDADLDRRVAGLRYASGQARGASTVDHRPVVDEASAEADLASLCDRRLAPLFWQPTGDEVRSAWSGHVPFAHWLIGAMKPYVLAELGTRRGGSYLAFCRAVKDHATDTRCYAVDTWEGDPHTGKYGQEIFDALNGFNESRYGHFSKLLRMRFDMALPYFSDHSIDLLHIDGYHTYEAVSHDFLTWQRKLSPRAVVLFHDTQERQSDFGVWRLWRDLREQYPAFEFHHSHGLGVLAVGPEAASPLRALCALAERPAGEIVRQRFAVLGSFWTDVIGARDNLRPEGPTLDAAPLREEVRNLRAQTDREGESVSRLRRRVAELESEQAALLGSTSWRVSAPLRQVGSVLPSGVRRAVSRLAGLSGRAGRDRSGR